MQIQYRFAFTVAEHFFAPMNKSTISIIQRRLSPTHNERMRAQARLRLTTHRSWTSAPAMRLAISFAVVALFISSQTLPTDTLYEVRQSSLERFEHVVSSDDDLLLDADQLLERIDHEDQAATKELEF